LIARIRVADRYRGLMQVASTPPEQMALVEVLRVLADEKRLDMVRLLADGALHPAAEVAEHVGLPASTCSYHLGRLLAAGVTECWVDGTVRYPVLRAEALEGVVPGLVAAIVGDDRASAAPAAP
jgi:DNA-binding transcriptional ArsR family regulator